MSLLGRLQDMFGLVGEYEAFDDDPSYIQQDTASSYARGGKGQRQAGMPPDNVIEMPGLATFQSELIVMEPRMFEEIPEAIVALRERKIVILNLTHMDADQAQRSVDYVAGGVFAIDGHQERIGINVFLFTPNSVHINTYVANPAGLPNPSPNFRNPFVPPSTAPQSLAERLEVRGRTSHTSPSASSIKNSWE